MEGSESARGRLLQILFACLPEHASTRLISWITPPMRASTLLRSNIILLQQVINHTHCPIKTIAAIEFYLDSCGCEVSYFAPVIMNRMEAMHIRHVHMHDSIVEDAIDAIRMLTPGVMRVDILHTSVFYHALLQVIEDTVECCVNASLTLELLTETNALLKRQLEEDRENEGVLRTIVTVMQCFHV